VIVANFGSKDIWGQLDEISKTPEEVRRLNAGRAST